MDYTSRNVFKLITSAVEEAIADVIEKDKYDLLQEQYSKIFNMIRDALPSSRKKLINELDKLITNLDRCKERTIYTKGLQDGVILGKIIFPDRCVNMKEYSQLTSKMLENNVIDEFINQFGQKK